MGFMVVSAVDLLYVFGRSFVLSDQVPSSSVRWEPTVVVLCPPDRPGMGYGGTE